MRAARYRRSRASEGWSFEDAWEAVQNLLDAEAFDAASELAFDLSKALVSGQQSMAALGVAGEVLRRMPTHASNWRRLCGLEADTCASLGLTDRALAAWRRLHAHVQVGLNLQPDNPDLQRDLSVSLI